jgi:hypothetical protein
MGQRGTDIKKGTEGKRHRKEAEGNILERRGRRRKGRERGRGEGDSGRDTEERYRRRRK